MKALFNAILTHFVFAMNVRNNGAPETTMLSEDALVMFPEDGMTVNSPWTGRFLKSTPLVFHVFIDVAVMVQVRVYNWRLSYIPYLEVNSSSQSRVS